MQILAEAHSYATYKNAKRRLEQVLGVMFDDMEWAIFAQEDGRFTPAVKLTGKNSGLMAYLLSHNVAMFN